MLFIAMAMTLNMQDALAPKHDNGDWACLCDYLSAPHMRSNTPQLETKLLYIYIFSFLSSKFFWLNLFLSLLSLIYL